MTPRNLAVSALLLSLFAVEGPALAATPARTAAPLVAAPQVELVRRREAEPVSSERSGFFDYIKDSFTSFMPPELHAKVEDKKVIYWLLGSLFSAIGGHIWAPMIFWGDVPDNDAKQTALMLGVVATILYWVPGWFPFVLPGAWFYGIGWVVAMIWWVVVEWFIMPKAVLMAYSDAYNRGGGGGGGSSSSGSSSTKRKRRRSSDDDD